MYITGANYEGCFNDKRLEKRGKSLLSSLFRGSTGVIQQLSQTRAEQKGYYRFLNNDRVKEGDLVSEITTRCGRHVEGKLVLCIQDSSEVNLVQHSRKLDPDSGVGLLDADHISKGIGFKFHPTLVIDALNYFPIGWSDIQLWNRPMERNGLSRPAMQRMPIENKESYKWLRSVQNSQAVLKQASGRIMVQDREADIYEFLAQDLDANTYLLVRSRCDRNLQEDGMLWKFIENQPAAGSYTMQVNGDDRSQQPAREAIMEVRYGRTEIRKPGNVRSAKQSVPVSIIEVREINSIASEPLKWRLITTLGVDSFMDACQMIEWYSCRWAIEEVFRALKKEKFKIESSEMQQGWAIRKLTVMMLDTIIKLFQMQYAYSIEEGADLDATMCFTTPQINCLEAVTHKMEGKTEKQKNPFKTGTLARACWTLARLGGWKGYQSQRPPGITTWCVGLEKFYNIFEGYNLQIDVGTP